MQFYLRDNKSLLFLNQFQFLQTKLNSLIEESKEKYYVPLYKKLLDYQALLNNKKVPCTPHLLQQDKFTIDFKEKAEAFSYFFPRHSSIMRNKIELPSKIKKKNHINLYHQLIFQMVMVKIIRNLRWFYLQTFKTNRSVPKSGKFPSEWKKQMWFQLKKRVMSKY